MCETAKHCHSEPFGFAQDRLREESRIGSGQQLSAEPNRNQLAEPIRIKPHHLVDIITSSGRGQAFEPHAYGHALHTVAARILADPDVTLVMEGGADDICAPCSHNIGGACDDTIDTSFRPTAPPRKQDWNLLLDRRWCERLGLEFGDVLTARHFCQHLRDQAGDLADIYPEMPAAHTADRAKNLHAGIERFLRHDRQSHL
jgi:hypothetical protein